MTERDEALNDFEHIVRVFNLTGDGRKGYMKAVNNIRAALQSPVPEEWREAVRDLAEGLDAGYKQYYSKGTHYALKKHASVIEAAQKGGGDA